MAPHLRPTHPPLVPHLAPRLGPLGLALAPALCALPPGCAAPEEPPAAIRLDDAPPACAMVTERYRVTGVDLAFRRRVALDLDHDGRRDNALGIAADLVAEVLPWFDPGPRLAPRLAGPLAWVIAVERCADPAAGDEARVTVEQAMALGGGLEVPRLLPRAVGALRGTALSARDGAGRVPLRALAGAADAGWLAGDGLRVEGQVTATSLSATLALGLDPEEARHALAAPVAALAAELPPGDPLRALADGNQDGVVTAEEIAATRLFALLTAPDVELTDPQGLPRGQGAATSLALRVVAARVP